MQAAEIGDHLQINLKGSPIYKKLARYLKESRVFLLPTETSLMISSHGNQPQISTACLKNIRDLQQTRQDPLEE